MSFTWERWAISRLIFNQNHCTKCTNKILSVRKMHNWWFYMPPVGHRLRAGTRRRSSQLVAAGMLTALDNVTARGRRERILQRHIDAEHDFTRGAHVPGRWVGQGRLIHRPSQKQVSDCHSDYFKKKDNKIIKILKSNFLNFINIIYLVRI